MIIEASTFGDVSVRYREILVRHDLPDIIKRNKDVHRWFIDIQDAELRGFAGVTKVGVRSILFGHCHVFPQHRGLGIQRELIKARETHARNWNYAEMLAYIERENHYSGNNLIRCGFLMAEPWDDTLDDTGRYVYFRKEA